MDALRQLGAVASVKRAPIEIGYRTASAFVVAFAHRSGPRPGVTSGQGADQTIGDPEPTTPARRSADHAAIRPSRVFRLAGVLIATGLALGLAGSLRAAKFLAPLLFQVEARDP
jgi:hypothetical protein